ncbi:unnamed protein product [Phaedon cochleariae]|uniref:CUB domain-containing protein n=1 Tax=Phaedon cochleariae TaxID=80249 RepID=A0A9P0DQW0_PHACE|nr:unnamed protein product [Phaedon cochleariae]
MSQTFLMISVGFGFGVGLVRFANSVCTTAANIEGICYRRRQCADINGVASGACANGIGVCCIILRTCSESSSHNGTYFTNAAYPTAVTGSSRCSMEIQKCNSNICQVRIDFLSLVLAQPNATGFCTTDALIITGGGGTVPVICGDNTGQHVYVDFNGDENILMTITTGSASTLGRSWNLKITQIACDCPTRAPAGCLQFYNTTTGTVTSFNYGVGSNIIDATTGLPGTRELVNENYGICVGMLPGYCSIQWTSNGFSVSGIPGGEFDALSNGDCTTDFVVIANPFNPNGVALGTDRFCGTSFNTVVSTLKPFVLYVVTNGDEINDVANSGFSLSFTQQPCTNTAAALLGK